MLVPSQVWTIPGQLSRPALAPVIGVQLVVPSKACSTAADALGARASAVRVTAAAASVCRIVLLLI
jgi:hypothetical protein